MLQERSAAITLYHNHTHQPRPIHDWLTHLKKSARTLFFSYFFYSIFFYSDCYSYIRCPYWRIWPYLLWYLCNSDQKSNRVATKCRRHNIDRCREQWESPMTGRVLQRIDILMMIIVILQCPGFINNFGHVYVSFINSWAQIRSFEWMWMNESKLILRFILVRPMLCPLWLRWLTLLNVNYLEMILGSLPLH